jgi:phosphohistidine phosphatase
MDLILWRHAEAEPGEPDLGRRLTAKGIQQAERMARWLDRHLPATTRILTSPADRAEQTARALKRKYRVVPELAPGGSRLPSWRPPDGRMRASPCSLWAINPRWAKWRRSY